MHVKDKLLGSVWALGVLRTDQIYVIAERLFCGMGGEPITSKYAIDISQKAGEYFPWFTDHV